MTENDNIEKLFRDSFEDFQVAPPADVKARIDKQLGARPRRFIFWILAAALVSALSALGLQAYFSSTQTSASTAYIQTSFTSQHAASQHGTGSADRSGVRSGHPASRPSTTHSATTGTPSNRTASANTSTNAGAKNSTDVTKEAATGKMTTGAANGKPQKSGSPVPAAGNKKAAVKTKSTHSFQAAGKSPGNSVPSGIQTTTSGNPTAGSGSKASSSGGDANTGIAGTIQPASGNTIQSAAAKTSDPAGLATTPATAAKSATSKDSSKVETATENTDTPAKKSDTEKPGKKPDASKKWLVQLQPGIGFGSASKAAQDVKTVPGLGISAGIYRELGPVRAGIDVAFGNGRFNWSKDTTLYTETLHDSIVTYQQDSIIYTDTIYYVVTDSSTQSTAYRSSYSQLSFGLSAQFDAPLTDKLGFVLTPGFRYAQTKFVRESDGASFRSGKIQLALGLDVYYDWKYWRFTLGAGYTHTWLKNTQNPFLATGLSQFTPRIGIGFRF